MLGRHEEQRPRSTGRRTEALLPVLDRAHRDAEQARELRLREAGTFPDGGDGRNRRDTTGLAALQFAQSLEDLGADLPRASHPVPL